MEKNTISLNFQFHHEASIFFTKKNQSYRNVDFLVLRNFSKEFTAAPIKSKDTLQNERDGNFIKLNEQTRLLDQKEYRRNNEFSIQP